MANAPARHDGAGADQSEIITAVRDPGLEQPDCDAPPAPKRLAVCIRRAVFYAANGFLAMAHAAADPTEAFEPYRGWFLLWPGRFKNSTL